MRVLLLLTLLAAVSARAQAPGEWSPYGAGTPFPVDALALGPDGAPYALYTQPVRYVDQVRFNSEVYAARWNGSAWAALPATLSCSRGCSGYALAVGPDGAVYVSASLWLAAGRENHLNVWRTGWTELFEGSIGAKTVEALHFAPDATLYVGGHAFGFSGSSSTIARLSGSRLSPVGTQTGFADALALAVAPDGTLYAGGTTNQAEAEARVARWNGTEWEPLGARVGARAVYALAVAPDGTLYAAGSFTEPGGLNRVARWDGGAWQPLGDGIADGVVSALAVTPDGALYAGGTFTTAGGAPANRIARWDGVAWAALGAGLDGPITALEVAADGALVVGGAFATAGGVAAANVARFAPAPVAAEAAPAGAAVALGAPSPNPATGRVRLGYTVAHEGRVRLAVVDMLGREVAVIVDGVQAGGHHEAAVAGGRLAPGVYVVRLEAAGTVATRRLTVAR